ncbi:hypothetical protein [Occultella kanbiaonis]|nr:hypothetical protein [Occultella kanbiaonis]
MDRTRVLHFERLDAPVKDEPAPSMVATVPLMPLVDSQVEAALG